MRPSTHAHTGKDGTLRISASDIEFADVAQPQAPSDLRLVKFTQAIVPPGVTLFDALISWEGSDEHTYDVQVTRI
jgi:hypothetical protein